MPKKNDLTGQRFGRLTVISECHEQQRRYVRWICQCDCGNTTQPIPGCHLRSGNTKSCGCLHNDELRERMTVHGKKRTRLYGVWNTMKNRCFNAQRKDYRYYGGRGITVCNDWKDNFQAFYDWAMANGYDPSAKQWECTLDRIDVNGDYTPENCRWVSMKEQSANKRAGHEV